MLQVSQKFLDKNPRPVPIIRKEPRNNPQQQQQKDSQTSETIPAKTKTNRSQKEAEE